MQSPSVAPVACLLVTVFALLLSDVASAASPPKEWVQFKMSSDVDGESFPKFPGEVGLKETSSPQDLEAIYQWPRILVLAPTYADGVKCSIYKNDVVNNDVFDICVKGDCSAKSYLVHASDQTIVKPPDGQVAESFYPVKHRQGTMQYIFACTDKSLAAKNYTITLKEITLACDWSAADKNDNPIQLEVTKSNIMRDAISINQTLIRFPLSAAQDFDANTAKLACTHPYTPTGTSLNEKYDIWLVWAEGLAEKTLPETHMGVYYPDFRRDLTDWTKGLFDSYKEAAAAASKKHAEQMAVYKKVLSTYKDPSLAPPPPASPMYMPCNLQEIFWVYFSDAKGSYYSSIPLCFKLEPGLLRLDTSSIKAPVAGSTISVTEGVSAGTSYKLQLSTVPTADVTCDVTASTADQITINGGESERLIFDTSCVLQNKEVAQSLSQSYNAEALSEGRRALSRRRLLSMEIPAFACADKPYDLLIGAVDDDKSEGAHNLQLQFNCTSTDSDFNGITANANVQVTDNDFGLLQWLWTSGGTLSPAYVRTTFSYTSAIAYNDASINVACFPTSTDLSCNINGAAVAYGSTQTIQTPTGSTTVTIQVLDSTGKVWSTYTVSVSRPLSPALGPPAPPHSVKVTPESTSAVVTWSAVQANPLVSRYRIRRVTVAEDNSKAYTTVYDSLPSVDAASNLMSLTLSNLPVATTQEYDITAVNDKGESLSVAFQVTTTLPPPRPTLTAVTPLTTPGTGGTTVTITGTNLGTKPGQTTVTVAGLPCGSVVWKDSTQITCVTSPSNNGFPAGTSGSGGVVVSTAGGSSTETFTFTYQGPLPTAVVPGIAPKDARYTKVEITVSGVANLDDISSVTIGADSSCVEGSLTRIPPNRLTCTIPSALVSTGVPHGTAVPEAITIKLSNGQYGVASGLYTHYALAIPTITSIVPSRGSFKGGTTIIVEGHHLGADDESVVSVTIGGVSCGKIKVLSDQKLSCVTGPSASSTPSFTPSPVIVKTKEGGASNGDVTFTYAEATPIVENIRPKVTAHEGGTVVTIKGQYLGNNPKDVVVTIGGMPCSPIRSVNETELVCVAPASGETGEAATMTEPLGTKRHVRVVHKQTPGFANLDFRFGEVCPTPCPWNSECVSKQCICLPGFAGTDCAGRNVQVSKPTGHLTEDGGKATFTVNLAYEPAGFVMVVLASNDTTEGVVEAPSVLRFNKNNWKEPQNVVVKPIPDTIRDGNVTFEVRVLVSSDDEMFANAPPVPSVYLVNDDRAPKIISVEPQTLPTVGGNLTLRGRELDKVVTVNLINPNTKDRIVTKIVSRKRVLKALRPARSRSTVSLLQTTASTAIQTPAATTSEDEENIVIYVENMQAGYTHFELINLNGGTELLENHILFTDNCPEPGTYGVAGECHTCPPCAECPGGDRMWPQEGCWNSGETSGFVGKCEPAWRCTGGKEAGCALGYEGDFCARCAEGYVAVGETCVSCPSPSSVWLYILCDVAVWVGFAIAAVFVKDRMTLSYVVAGVRMLQLLGGIGRMRTHELPDWLQTTYNILHLFSGDYEVLKPDCYSRPSYLAKFFGGLFYNFITFVPTFVMVGVGGVIARLYHQKVLKSEPDVIQERREWYHDRFVRSVMIFLAVSYMSVATRVFEAISCRPVEGTGKYFLITLEYVQCFTVEHTIVFVCSLILIGTLVLAFPIMYFMFLKRRPERIFSDERLMEKCNFVYELFNDLLYRWFVLDFVIAATIAAGNTFLTPLGPMQFIACSVVIIFKLVLIAWKKPYIDRLTNLIQFFITLALLVAVNINFLAQKGLDTTVLSTGGTFMLIATLCALVILVFVVLRMLLTSSKQPIEVAEGDSELYDLKGINYYDATTDDGSIFQTYSYMQHSWMEKMKRIADTVSEMSVSVASDQGSEADYRNRMDSSYLSADDTYDAASQSLDRSYDGDHMRLPPLQTSSVAADTSAVGQGIGNVLLSSGAHQHTSKSALKRTSSGRGRSVSFQPDNSVDSAPSLDHGEVDPTLPPLDPVWSDDVSGGPGPARLPMSDHSLDEDDERDDISSYGHGGGDGAREETAGGTGGIMSRAYDGNFGLDDTTASIDNDWN